MCAVAAIPVAMQWVLAATTVAAGVGQAVQMREEGRANAAIEENNARLAEDQAAAARAVGDRESQQQAWQTRAAIGAQRAAIASAGVDASIGTPADILGETAMFGEADQQAIRLRAAQEAYGFTSEANNARNRGMLGRWSSNQKAGATILSSLSQAAGSFRGG